MKPEELKAIIASHALWLEDSTKGERANLSDANLSDANLSDANLSDANLSDANLSRANLSYANLSRANLSYANLSRANLSYANLSDANLSRANLSYADAAALARTFVPPESGSFEAWKKCACGVLVKLLIPAEAKRSSATGRKCRAEWATVLAVDGGKEGISLHDPSVVYRVGETVKCHRWEENRWIECGGGIHFYITKAEAEAYK